VFRFNPAMSSRLIRRQGRLPSWGVHLLELETTTQLELRQGTRRGLLTSIDYPNLTCLSLTDAYHHIADSSSVQRESFKSEKKLYIPSPCMRLMSSTPELKVSSLCSLEILEKLRVK
jgi:hypothetical protein